MREEEEDGSNDEEGKEEGAKVVTGDAIEEESCVLRCSSRL